MFSALKRLVGNQNDNKSADDFFNPSNGKGLSRSGVHPMGYQLQKEFSRGVQYNMKIIIKGDRNVGKSCLFKRLQGLPFDDEYKPTEEIQVANIHWNYKATDDIVKVEVWDVVDKGRKYPQMNGLKIENKARQEKESKEEQELALDAEFIDVYKATNGVIMMLDITKAWTFDYIQRELPKVPLNIPALVLANHRDMGHHRAISEDQVKVFIESLGRDKGPGQIRYAESSMSNGFGLKFLHKFFNLPFLHLQRETLKKQLETNQREIETTYQELDILQESDEQRYDKFLEMITNRRRAIADKLSQTVQPSAGPTRSVSMPVDLAKNKALQASSGASEIAKPNPSIIIGATKPLAINSNVSKVQQSQTSREENEIETDEDQIRFRSFLTESISEVEYDNRFEKVEEEKEESDDDKSANPMVSGYQEELDPEDDLPPGDNMAINESYIDQNLTSAKVSLNVPKEMQSTEIQKTGLFECTSHFDNEEDTECQKLFQVDKKRESGKSKLILTHETTSQSNEVATTKEVKSGKKRKEKGKRKSSKDEKGRRKVSEEDEDRRKLEEFLEPSPDLFSKREATEYELL